VYGHYRALGAVLHVVDRELDLRLLSDQRVLKERHAAQEDWVTGALNTEIETAELVSKSPNSRREARGVSEQRRIPL